MKSLPHDSNLYVTTRLPVQAVSLYKFELLIRRFMVWSFTDRIVISIAPLHQINPIFDVFSARNCKIAAEIQDMGYSLSQAYRIATPWRTTLGHANQTFR